MNYILSTRQLMFALGLLVSIAAPIRAQIATFSGRVTDQNTDQGIPDVAIVAQGNLTGTRVAISDSQGNYALEMGANTNIKLRAYRKNFIFNPAFVGFTSLGGFLTGTRSLDFQGAALPFPILIFGQAPILLTQDNSLEGLAVDSVFHLRDPIKLSNNDYFGSDKRTRLILLLVDLDLFQGETLSIISVQAQDKTMVTHNLVVEDLRKVPGVPWMSQLTVRLPGVLAVPNDLAVTVTARNATSNAVTFRVE
jgi:hypothetical protein